MNATKIKKVIYDSQGMAKAAAEHFDWLLVLDEALVQKFFIAMAVEQEDGSLLLPESIRSKVAVEVVWEDMKPVPLFDSPVAESDYDPIAEAESLRLSPTWDKAFSGNSLLFSDDPGEGADSGEFKLAALEDLPL